MRVYPDLTQDGEFQRLGGLGYSGSLNDRQFAFLRANLYTGALPDMMRQSVVSPAANRNLLTYTEQFDNSVWNVLGGALVVTPNTVIAPDGTLTADSIALASGFKVQSVTVSAGLSYIFSVYLRTDTGTKNIQLREANGSGQATVTATTEWQRFTLGYTTSGTSNFLGIDQRTGTSPSQSGTLFIWGSQLELGSVATAYQVRTV